jgi:hypothetical protein
MAKREVRAIGFESVFRMEYREKTDNWSFASMPPTSEHLQELIIGEQQCSIDEGNCCGSAFEVVYSLSLLPTTLENNHQVTDLPW